MTFTPWGTGEFAFYLVTSCHRLVRGMSQILGDIFHCIVCFGCIRPIAPETETVLGDLQH